MDPNRAWFALLAAIQRQDYDEAIAIAIDLHEWLVRGGFPPCVIGDLRNAAGVELSVAYKLQHELATAACAFIIEMK